MQSPSFDTLVAQFLGCRLPAPLAAQVRLSALPVEAQDFIHRMLLLMQRAAFPATDITPLLLRALTLFVPHALVASRDGTIPPITLPGRHHRLDAYLAQRTEAAAVPGGGPAPLFLDLGCGFPPVTTMDTAKRLENWRIVGVDRHFPPFMVIDRKGHYACFNTQGDCVHVQTRMNDSGREMNADPTKTRDHFTALFRELMALLPDCGKVHRADSDSDSVANANGDQLLCHHIRTLETDRLRFLEAEIDDLELPPAQAIRCMNVLLYFPAHRRRRLLDTMQGYLAEEGLLIAGFNHYLGSGARYRIYRKRSKKGELRAFAFSLDNLRSLGIAPWYTLQGDDEDAALLADLTATLRADARFWPEFSRRVDALLEEKAICRRGDDGFLQFPDQPMPLDRLMQGLMALWRRLETEGFAAQAVRSLQRAGHEAWVNAAGDVAIRPLEREISP